ncbi:hypothetical protein BaRGS_00039445 [Batillaria attramentaria]|uniref:Uncharacterized protein n=1 Tax=Batillaria attramentaria TaxID=370345 RepID=A0ABD0J3T6_9CAEN
MKKIFHSLWLKQTEQTNHPTLHTSADTFAASKAQDAVLIEPSVERSAISIHLQRSDVPVNSEKSALGTKRACYVETQRKSTWSLHPAQADTVDLLTASC